MHMNFDGNRIIFERKAVFWYLSFWTAIALEG